MCSRGLPESHGVFGPSSECKYSNPFRGLASDQFRDGLASFAVRWMVRSCYKLRTARGHVPGRGHMRRREFIRLIGGAAALPSAALSQQLGRGRRIPSVGILNYAAADDALVNDFRSALGELGHVEGQSLTITYRWADGRFERLPNL